jgi:hypothetical protein
MWLIRLVLQRIKSKNCYVVHLIKNTNLRLEGKGLQKACSDVTYYYSCCANEQSCQIAAIVLWHSEI